LLFQEGALFDSMSVADNVAYRLHEDGVPEEEIAPRVLEVLRFIELEHTLDLFPRKYRGYEAPRVDCQGGDQPAAHRALRFADGGTRPGDVADHHYADSALARRVRSDSAAGHAALAGRICAGKFSFRSGNQTGCSECSEWQRRGGRERGQNAIYGLPGWRHLFRRRTRRDRRVPGPYLKRFLE